MPLKINLRLMDAILVALVCCPAPGMTQGERTPVRSTWAVGQEWRLLVRPYGKGFLAIPSSPRDREKALVPHVDGQFHVTARVTEVVKCEGRDCVRIQFTPESDAPVINSTNPPRTDVVRNQEYTLTLDAQTWQAVGLEGKPEISLVQVLAAEDCRALLAQAWFPVAWVIARSDLENPAERTELLNFPGFRPTADRPAPNTALRRSISAADQDGTVRIAVGDVGLNKSGEPRREARNEVEQVWHPGELWWRSFRRFGGGHINMEAILVSDPDGSGKTLEAPTSRPSAGPSVPAGPTWTVGQEWRFFVKDYFSYPDTTPKLVHEYHIRAHVTELTKVDGRECARIEFIPEADAPGMLSMPGFTLVVDRQTWSPVGLEYPKKHNYSKAAAEAGGYKALVPAMPGYPFDWVVLRSDLASRTAREEFFHFPGLKSVARFGFRRVISAPQKDATLRITVGLWVPTQDPQDMTYESAKDAMCEVEQVWHAGELWWRSFRRLSHGQLDLEATRVSEGVQP